MKKRIVLFALFFYACFSQAQQQVASFPDLYKHFNQKYFTPGSNMLPALVKGFMETTHFTCYETAAFKAKARENFGKEGSDLYRLMADSLFHYVQHELIPLRFEKEFTFFKEPLNILNKEYCLLLKQDGTGAPREVLKKAGEKLPAIVQGTGFRMAYEKALKMPGHNGEPLSDNAVNAYLFTHCPEHAHLRKEVLLAEVSDNSANYFNTLLYSKVSELLESWRKKNKVMEHVEAIFPGYRQQIPVLNQVAQQDGSGSITNDFDFETDSSGKPHSIFFTYYKGKGQKLVILNRVVFSFFSSSEHAQLNSIRVIPFAQIPNGNALLKKARRESDPKNIKPPPFPKELLKKN